MLAFPDVLDQCKKDPEWAAELIITQKERIEKLESQINKNSQNSSKPPSSDGFKKPKPKSLRSKTGRPQGGQQGHRGHTLHQVEEPDEVVEHTVDHCHQCSQSLKTAPARYERRQVFDIPPLAMHVMEHRREIKSCPFCQTENRAAFPERVRAPVQYGPRLKVLGVYLHNYQLLPYDRIRDLSEDLFHQPISRATIIEAERQMYNELEPIEKIIAQQLRARPVAHFDETGLQVNGKNQWLHVASTDTFTHYTAHPKRGQEGMDAGGILPDFKGVAVHDAWNPYFKYTGCDHALCNAHHLRELTGIYEQEGQVWAKDMIDLLLEMKQVVEEETILDIPAIHAFEQRFNNLIEQGLGEDKRLNPPQNLPKPKRGRKKQSPAKNLLDRLQTYRENVLGFIRNPNIPFDNNQAERDVRMVKVQQKISGTFRDPEGAKRFCRIRGYTSTMKKQSHSIMEALRSVMMGNPLIPGEKRNSY